MVSKNGRATSGLCHDLATSITRSVILRLDRTHDHSRRVGIDVAAKFQIINFMGNIKKLRALRNIGGSLFPILIAACATIGSMGDVTEEDRQFFDQQISSADTVVISFDWGMVQTHAGTDDWGLAVYEDSESFPEYFDNLAEQAGELIAELWPGIEFRIETDLQASDVKHNEVLMRLETDRARIDHGNNLRARWSMTVDERPIVYFGRVSLSGARAPMSDSAWDAVYRHASTALHKTISELPVS